MNRIKERCIAALRQHRQDVAEDFVLDEITILLADRPAPPHNSREMRERVKELRREREEKTKAWQRKLFRQGLLRLAVLLAATACLVISTRFGDVGALVACVIGVAIVGFFYHEKTQGASVIRAAAVQKGVVAGAGIDGDVPALPGRV